LGKSLFSYQPRQPLPLEEEAAPPTPALEVAAEDEPALIERARQRRQRHWRVEAGLQQDAPGSDHERTFGNRVRRRCCLSSSTNI
jgi:hypothetical protein